MHVAEFSELCHLSIGERPILLSISREVPFDWLARIRFLKIVFHALLRNFPGLQKSRNSSKNVAHSDSMHRVPEIFPNIPDASSRNRAIDAALRCSSNAAASR